MEKITPKEFLMRQPREKVLPTDPYFVDLANRLLEGAEAHKWKWSVAALKRAALCLTDYYQDILADAGVWRSFVSVCRKWYGKPVPFYEVSEDYVDHELNKEDVQFLVWYSLALNSEDMRSHSPLADDIMALASDWYVILEADYDGAPVPEGFMHWRELEGDKKKEHDALYQLSNWLFLHCWLTTPAASLALTQIFQSLTPEQQKDITVIHDRLEQAMMEEPTGPVALYVGEWVNLLINGKIPPMHYPEPAAEREHPYYTAFTKATGGKIVSYFATYEELNKFFIEGLGWEKDKEHLSQMKEHGDFVLMVNKDKGMLLAKDISKCISDPDNPTYDRDYARDHAFELLSVRGRCPADLLLYICGHGWLPDAHFQGSDDTGLVASNWDFIARCYLQMFYRGD